jgi:hypothetical protein
MLYYNVSEKLSSVEAFPSVIENEPAAGQQDHPDFRSSELALRLRLSFFQIPPNKKKAYGSPITLGS